MSKELIDLFKAIYSVAGWTGIFLALGFIFLSVITMFFIYAFFSPQINKMVRGKKHISWDDLNGRIAALENDMKHNWNQHASLFGKVDILEERHGGKRNKD